MDFVKMIRDEKDGIQGDFGKMFLGVDYFCEFLQPDVLDETQVPPRYHLPAGEYILKRYESPKHGWTFVIQRPDTPFKVDGHSFLEIHAGNVIQDTLGCTVVGSERGKLKGERAVLNSGNTFKAFMEKMEGIDECPLIVEDNYEEAGLDQS